jgi:hypothetical protein
MRPRECGGIGHASLESREEPVDKPSFRSESRQQCQVDVDREARLSPTLKGDPSNEAEPPALRLAERLQRGGRCNDLSNCRPPS